ncbi:MAG: transporter substrate-binding domain-containing protein [Ruminococcaceae bacterium]|nr:transporter substrate-binding domain-containing protein [Oscillospiraceae bacterium]
MTALLCLLLAAVFALSPGAAALAAEDAPGMIRVGYYENEVFQEGARPGAVKTGYAYEYYLKLSEYTGWKYDYVYGDFGELYQQLLDGEIDLLAGLAWKEERAGRIGYPNDPMGSETYSLVKHDSDPSITAEASTLSGRTIGVLDSAIADALRQYLDGHAVRANVVTFSDYEALFSAFDEQRVDILAAEGDGAYGREHAEVLCAFGASDYYLCVSAARADLLGELNAAQTHLFSDEPNYISSLRAKYYPVSISSRAFSEAEKEWIRTHSGLRIGYLDHYLPYSDTNAQGEVDGVVRELVPIVGEVLGISGITVSYRGFESYDALVAAINAGEIDAAFPVGGGLYYSEENGIYQSSPVISASTELVFRSESGGDAVSRFAVNENNRMQYYYVRTNFPEAEIAYYASIESCLDAVLSGEADCTTLNGLRANDILRNSRYSELSMRQLNRSDDRCFGVKIGNEGLLRLLNRGIGVIGSDYAQNLAYRYTDGLYTYTFADMARQNALLFGAVLLGIAALVIGLVARDSRRTKKSREALSKALLAAEEANRAKSDFLSNMSHEIRTPITAILGMNEMIRRESGDEDVLSYSESINRAGESLLGIISDILDFSKIEAGHMELVPTEYDLAGLIDDTLNLTRLRAESKGLLLETEVDPTLPGRLRGDEIRIKQILTNLLSNAVKYTEKGSVCLSLASERTEGDDVWIRVSVQDTGIGISEEDRSRLFSAFDRLDAAHTRTIEGTGLGLAITHKLLSMMGSEISVESEYGAGSTFSFTLRQSIVDREPIGSRDFAARSGALRARHGSRTPFLAPDARLLLVDDTQMNLQVICGLLKRTEIRIDAVESGEECLERFGAEDYDIVVLDYRMPGMDGIETLARLGELYPEKRARTPVICLTASAVTGVREKMLAAGFTDYVTKPVDIERMEAVLIQYLPKEKITLAEDAPQEDPLALLPPEIFDIPNLDPAAGITFCGDAESYMAALRSFAGSIEARADQIGQCLASEDVAGYTLRVHSLKSTARAVGALEVSDRAKALEEAGNQGDAGALRRDTPRLLEAYRGMQEPLEALFRELEGAREKQPLSEAEFDDACATIRELCGLYDDAGIQDILDELNSRAIPDSRAALYRDLCEAAGRVDWEALSKLSGAQ